MVAKLPSRGGDDVYVYMSDDEPLMTTKMSVPCPYVSSSSHSLEVDRD